MKVKIIPGNGCPEYFQRYAFDKFFHKTSRDEVCPAYDTMPARSGITLQDYFRKKYKGMYKLLCS